MKQYKLYLYDLPFIWRSNYTRIEHIIAARTVQSSEPPSSEIGTIDEGADCNSSVHVCSPLVTTTSTMNDRTKGLEMSRYNYLHESLIH